MTQAAQQATTACRTLYTALNELDHHACGLLGISRNDLACLNLLERGPVPAGRIAAALGLTSGSVTTMIDRLERQKLVERMRDANDRRSVLVSATPRVFETIGRFYAGFAQRLEALVDARSPEEQEQMIESLSAVAQCCADHVAAQSLHAAK
ncbi:MarR family winged helix-turn-helix transcriptional regulator [Qipengyuania qiaonensis]|uniref:MarR family transcriptional regulator n=1 Tax=Qipengyuania qiaonensis TaxID=2867240 RepID=A0ABS7J2Z7_9SPHN|nr:MarR family transcriptional regulator [Qipengyuania qiaonensis]MBX7481700.1 MarR family transcriptional regulator [Qipengyuania qiaonensis]